MNYQRFAIKASSALTVYEGFQGASETNRENETEINPNQKSKRLSSPYIYVPTY